MNDSYNIEVIDSLDGLLALRDVWNTVLDDSQSGHVSLTLEWFMCWWKAYSDDNSGLRVVLVRDKEGVIRGIAPFMLKTCKFSGFKARKLSFIYNDNSSRADLIVCGQRRDVLQAVFSYIKKIRHEWDVLELENISEDSPNSEILLETLKSQGARFVLKNGLKSPYIRITEDWPGYLSTLSKKCRKNLRYIVNRLDDNCAYHIDKYDDGAVEESVLAKVFSISAASWKGHYGKHITNLGQNRIFFEELNRVLGEKKWQHIWILYINNQAVAYEYILSYKQKAYPLKADFDQQYEDLAPGAVLNMHVIKNYIDSKYSEFDFCGDEDDYKKRFTQTIRRHKHFVVYGQTLYGRALYLIDYLVIYRVKMLLKSFPQFKKIKKAFNRRKG
jgi:CelD/BcsL family acetyltransferase involved in cellulose biosynthesis